jgi:hypothetical protein
MTATYERATRTVTVTVDACGEIERGTLELEEIEPPSDCYTDGAVLRVRLKHELAPGTPGKKRWSAERSFRRSAEYVVSSSATTDMY